LSYTQSFPGRRYLRKLWRGTIENADPIMQEVVGETRRLIKRKIGWLCSYVPVEIITAAGLEPVRIFPEPEDIDKTRRLAARQFFVFT
jgi:benzoyl-CoA reductase/2-hydroxyglutaryl-CoA dehydratase subunit BcrC/BadD/HgdB